MTSTPEAPIRRARLATFAAFTVNGLVMATWVISIPSIQARTHVSHAVLGGLLLLLGSGAFVGMQLCGWLADKFGSRATVVGSGILLGLVAVLPGLATSALTLGMALLALGVALGGMDVAMNAHAVIVERRYRRPIMAAFHAYYSIGGAVGSLLGAGLLAWGWHASQVLLAGGGVAIMTVLWARTALLPPAPILDAPNSNSDSAVTTTTSTTALALDPAISTRAATPWWHLPRVVWLLGGAAFLLMLAEGVANDWSALQITERFEATDSVAALGYGAFAVSMTVGRLVTDRIVTVVGPPGVVLFGAVIAASGLAVVAFSPVLWLTIVGWSILGLGLSGGVPQLFTAAGNLPTGASSVNMSRVVGMGYVGQLAGPALIGAIANHISLTTALLVPAIGCFIVVTFRKVITPALDSSHHDAMH